ncbi:hypothetical protein [Dyella sp. OK004]|uniref:hypothetical protein n=1 Tax=Dyella sp. OK004 TaxID=1855292 RepID=UPI0011607981|nr:hypothetical protein [Dyella sp. OK004]
MNHILAGAVLFCFVAAWCVAAVAWFATLFFGIKAIRRARSDIKFWGRDTLWNPANVLLDSRLLTDEGVRYRRKCLLSAGLFVACTGILILIAAITGVLK